MPFLICCSRGEASHEDGGPRQQKFGVSLIAMILVVVKPGVDQDGIHDTHGGGVSKQMLPACHSVAGM